MNETETLCSACVVFAELSRRELVTMLFDAGYLSSKDLRSSAAELQSAIEDFTLVLEAVARGEEDLTSLAFALRKWNTVGGFAVGIDLHGLRVAAVSRKQLHCA